MTSKSVRNTYLVLTGLNTLAASFIWGVNTLFLLDAGLSNTQAFAANAFFTVGQVLFEIPTGIVADTVGRRASYLLGSATLFVTTLMYLMLWQTHSGFVGWAIVSILLGLGFTFFSGATEAWLVDALDSTGFKGSLDDVFAHGQIVAGGAMLIGATLGGVIAQKTNLGVPYWIRSGVLVISFLAAWALMKDLGFTPKKGGQILDEMKGIFRSSLRDGLGDPQIRWMMLVSPFMFGVSFYGFYAAQPLLLELYGDEKAYSIAGLAASLVAGSQMAGGFAVPFFRKVFARRSSMLGFIVVGSVVLMALVGLIHNFWSALIFMGLWGLLGSAMIPVRRAYLNELISSDKRATLLSFDGLMGSAGGALAQPFLGKSADIWGYSTSFVIAGALQIAALPFVILTRRERSKADFISAADTKASSESHIPL